MKNGDRQHRPRADEACSIGSVGHRLGTVKPVTIFQLIAFAAVNLALI